MKMKKKKESSAQTFNKIQERQTVPINSSPNEKAFDLYKAEHAHKNGLRIVKFLDNKVIE